MKKILVSLLGSFMAICAHAAQIVNVDYVHKLIAQKWDISVPIKADNPMQVANMKYLLTAIDVANEILNGEPTTNYGNGEFATLQVADITATNQAVETLIKKEIEYKFSLKYDTNYTENHVTTFIFDISAAGEFIVDWGDGNIETISRNNDTKLTSYSHTYLSDGVYTIKFAGKATKYNTASNITTISFNHTESYMDMNAASIIEINGSLGAIFGTLADGSQPRFMYTFFSTGFGIIPDTLFDGIFGCPTENMFKSTFLGTSIDYIPENLFSGISTDCILPSGVFMRTFMYADYNDNFFITGPSARINGQYLYEIWPDATCEQVGGMYHNTSGLSDYSSMPNVWKYKCD